MVRYSTLTFFFVSIVAIFSLSLFFDAQYSGGLVTEIDCARYASEFDVVIKNTLFRAQGQKGYANSYDTRVNPCTGLAEDGRLETLVQDPPLEQYGRFGWGTGAVYGYQGDETMKYGNIMYWYCPDNYRGRVVLSTTEVCNSFGDTYQFDDGARQRH